MAAEGTPSDVVPHKVMPGNHPTSTILAPELTPSVLGQLVALYEHTVFVEGAVWGIDSFDQWGVELGKVMAGQLGPALSADGAPDLSALDSSTAQLVRTYRAMRGRPTDRHPPRTDGSGGPIRRRIRRTRAPTRAPGSWDR